MIDWKRTRKNGVVSTGTKQTTGGKLTWCVCKSKGGLNYELHLGEVSATPMITRATIQECQNYADNFL